MVAKQSRAHARARAGEGPRRREKRAKGHVEVMAKLPDLVASQSQTRVASTAETVITINSNSGREAGPPPWAAGCRAWSSSPGLNSRTPATWHTGGDGVGCKHELKKRNV